MFWKVIALLGLFALLGTQFSFAVDFPASLPECSKIASACEAQGYLPGAHRKNGKGLWIDCIDAIAKGGTVNGVTGITADDAKACERAAKDERHAWKAAKGGASSADK